MQRFPSSALLPVSSILSIMIIGRVSDTALAVVGLSLAILFPLNTALARLVRSSAAEFAALHEKGHLIQIAQYFWQVFWLGLVISLILVGFFLVFPLTFRWIGVDGVMAHLTRNYLWVAASGLPAMGIILVYMSFLFGQGVVKPIMNVTLVGVLLSPPLTWFFAFWGFGHPLGVLGYCLSTVTVQWISVLLLTLVVRRHTNRQKLSLISNVAVPNLVAWKSIWKIGGPLAASALIRLGGGAIVAMYVAKSGALQMAAFQVANSIADSLIIPAGSLGMSVVVLLGQCVAATRHDQIRRVIISSFISSASITCVLAALLVLLRAIVVGLYTKDPGVMQIAERAIMPVVVYLAAQTMVIFCESILTVYKKTKFVPVVVMLGYALLVIPLSVFAEYRGFQTAYQVRMFIALGSIFTAILLALMSIRAFSTSFGGYQIATEGRIGVS